FSPWSKKPCSRSRGHAARATKYPSPILGSDSCVHDRRHSARISERRVTLQLGSTPVQRQNSSKHFTLSVNSSSRAGRQSVSIAPMLLSHGIIKVVKLGLPAAAAMISRGAEGTV